MIRYITIEREFGSGGRAIAEKLAEKWGVPCYGREILLSAAKRIHAPVEQLEKYEETAASSFLYTVALLGRARTADPDMLMREGHLYVAEQLAIRELAARGPAVFLGHCASEALAGQKGVIKVFVKADLEDRKKRARQYGIEPEQVDNEIRRFDKKRSGYYSVNTARKWHELKNYDIVLDSSALGVEACAESLAALVR